MKASFKQGIIQHQQPDFLNVRSSYVDLTVIDTPTTVTVADGAKSYLIVENASYVNAWGPIVNGQDQWLYWDIDRRTGQRTFGLTLVEPITQPSEPPSPTTDLHWFNPYTDEMQVWNGSRWLSKIRVFACKLAGGTLPISMSIDAPLFTGTQSGDLSESFAGQILFDANTNLPLKTPDGKFITTEDRLATSTITSSEVKLAALIVVAEAQQNMAPYTVVTFSDFGRVVHANQFTTQMQGQIGIVETAALTGEFVNVTLEGVISNPTWNWPAVNAYLYVDSSGTIVSAPPIPGAVPVATVVGKSSIVFGSPNVNVTVGSSGGTTDPATTTTIGTVAISVAPTNPTFPIAVGTNDPRMSDARTPLAHDHPMSDVIGLTTDLNTRVLRTGDTMTGNLILNADPTVALGAATKQYVDAQDTATAATRAPLVHTHTISDTTGLQTAIDAKVNKTGDTMTGDLILNADPTVALGAATKQYVDAVSTNVAGKVNRSGDTMTGALTLPGDPTAALHAATKQYVDNLASGASVTHQKLNADTVTLPIGAPVYSSSIGQVRRANAASHPFISGIVASSSISVGGTGTVQTSGMLQATTGQWDAVTGQVGGLTEGVPYYLSITQGTITTTAPSASGQYVVPLGFSVSSTQLFINIGTPVLL